MNHQDSKPNVVSLANRGIRSRFSKAQQASRQLLFNHLARQLDNVFAHVDDALFECAGKAQNNSEQALYFDSMRDIRKQRGQLERYFYQWLGEKFKAFADGSEDNEPAAVVAADELTLVQPDAYEESLYVSQMAERVRARCALTLNTLEAHLTRLNHNRPLSEERNPFSATLIAQAFSETLNHAAFPRAIRQALYQLFERHLMSSLDSLYDELVQLLGEPTGTALNAAQPKRQPEPGRAATPPATAMPEAPAHAHSAAPEAANPLPDAAAPLLANLTQLLARQRSLDADQSLFGGSPSITRTEPAQARQQYDSHELLAALTDLQLRAAHDLQQPLSVARLKSDLQVQLQTLGHAPGQHRLSQADADVIDLVGMLFDFILSDPELPDACKCALSHLHAPYLKIALQDRTLFTAQEHPARRLLNDLAQAGGLFGGGDDATLLERMRTVIQRITHDFSGDLSLFEALLDDFNGYVATLRRRIELREQRTIEAAKGRERLLSARQQAAGVIDQSLHGRTLAEPLRHLLQHGWTDVLVFILLRRGEDSDDWRRACATATRLTQNDCPADAGPPATEAAHERLLADLRWGLELLGGYHADSIDRLLREVVACLLSEPPATAADSLPADARTEAPAASEPGVQAPAGVPPAALQATMQRLQQVEFGTWFEFLEGGQRQLLKLTWFSPTSANYMFVDQAGQRAAVKSITLLAEEMIRGTARVMPQERSRPLMERALNAIYQALQRLTGRP